MALSAAWWGLLVLGPARRAWKQGRPLPLASSLAAQFTAGMIVASVMLRLGVVLTALLPPYLPLWLLSPPARVGAVLAQNREAVVMGLLSAVGAVGVMAALSPRLVRFGLLPGVILATAVTLNLAEHRSARRMEARAAESQADCLARRTFRASLGFWGEEFQFDLHAIARIGGAWHGWSYGTDDFYRIPDSAPIGGNGLQAACLDQIVDQPS